MPKPSPTPQEGGVSQVEAVQPDDPTEDDSGPKQLKAEPVDPLVFQQDLRHKVTVQPLNMSLA